MGLAAPEARAAQHPPLAAAVAEGVGGVVVVAAAAAREPRLGQIARHCERLLRRAARPAPTAGREGAHRRQNDVCPRAWPCPTVSVACAPSALGAAQVIGQGPQQPQPPQLPAVATTAAGCGTFLRHDAHRGLCEALGRVLGQPELEQPQEGPGGPIAARQARHHRLAWSTTRLTRPAERTAPRAVALGEPALFRAAASDCLVEGLWAGVAADEVTAHAAGSTPNTNTGAASRSRFTDVHWT